MQQNYLHDMLVVEVGDRIAVGACGSLLAQAGATVVIVDPLPERHSGKWTRRATAAAGKLSVQIDPDSAADRDLLAALVAAADVVLDSSDTQEAVASWSDDRPQSQIFCDITAFGHSGPWEGQGGSESVVQAVSGIVATTGPEDDEPVVAKISILEMSTAVYAACAVLAAWRVRRQIGIGQKIDMALIDVSVNALMNHLTLHWADQPATRSGNRHPLYSPWTSFQTMDGFVLICVVTAEQFGRMSEAIERPELPQDPRFSNVVARKENASELEREIAAWTMGRTVAECVATLSAVGVVCGPVVDLNDIAAEVNLEHRASIADVTDPDRADIAKLVLSPLFCDRLSRQTPDRIPVRDGDRAAIREIIRRRGAIPVAEEEVARVAVPRLPLEGIRVIEVGHFTVAPLASKQMGALGADVIKIESPSGDPVRKAIGKPGLSTSHIFVLGNTDKRGLVLDLRNERDQRRLHRLLAQSDVLIENLRQGALANLGFGSDVLRARHPHLICCSVSGFGAKSVYPGRPAFDTVIQAASGLMSNGEHGGQPMKLGISASDMLGGQFGLFALLAGLEYRDRTGIAVHFDISMQDASVWATQYQLGGKKGAEHRDSLLSATDGYVVVEVPTECPALGARSGTRAEIVDSLRRLGVNAAPVLDVHEVVQHPQVYARDLLIDRLGHDGMWRVLNSPIRLCRTPPQIRRVMTELGIDDAAVIDELKLDGCDSGGKSAA